MTIVFGLASVLAGLTPLWPVYQSQSFVIAAVVGVVLGALVAGIVRWRRWPWWLVLPGLAAVFLIVGVPVAVPTGALWGIVPTLEGEGELIVSAVAGWKQLVTITPPVGDYAGLLVPVFVLALACSAAVVLLSRPGRWSTLTVIPGLLSLGLAIWCGTGNSSLAAPAGVAVALATLGVFVRRVPGTIVRRLGAVALCVALVGVAGLATAMLADAPALWRTRIVPSLNDQSLPSPLSDYRAYITGDQAAVSMMSVAGARPGQLVSLATLSRYDGVTYTVGAPDGDFTRQSGFTTAPATGDGLDIAIDQLTGPWLPLPTRFDGLTATSEPLEDLYYSPQSHTAVDLNGLGPGLTYSVAGRALEAGSLASLGSSRPGTATTAVLDVPSGVESFVTAHSLASDPAGLRLRDVLEALTKDGYLSHGEPDEAPSRSGHSAERITALLTDKVMVGDAEQYAVAAALLAQQVGYPARVVVGFVMPAEGQLVHGADLGAWVEVATTDGWVAVDPTPAYRPIPQAPPQDPQRVSPPQPAVEPPPADASQVRDNAAPRSDERDDVAPPDPWRDILAGLLTGAGWVLLVVVVALLPPLSIVAAKAMRRRRRHRRPDARQAVLGARDQLADVLIDARASVTSATTNRELLGLAGQITSPLVRLLDRAGYSLDGLDLSDVRNAWVELDAVERDLGAPLTRWQRWRRSLSLRSLLIRRRSSATPHARGWLSFPVSAPRGRRRTERG